MLSQVSQEQSKPLLTMQFSTMLKKIKAKKREQFKIKTDAEEEEEFEKQMENELNSRQTNLENQKHLIKLYESNFSNVFESIKQEYKDYNYKKEEKKNLETQKNFAKSKFGFSQPKPVKYGFEQFNRTSYVNKNCMKELLLLNQQEMKKLSQIH